LAAKEYLALCLQTARNALPEVPSYLFYKVSGNLEPDPDYKEGAVHEWGAADTSQGDVEDERTSTAWKYAWESRVFPGEEFLLIMTHLLGGAAAPIALEAPDAAATRNILYTVSEIFGDGGSLGDQAIAIIPNTKAGANTYSQNFLGGRMKDAEFDFKGGEALMLKMTMMGGPWISAPEQPAIAGVAYPAAKALRSKPKVYLGDGAALTGVAPDYTDFLPGTMLLAKPDDLTIKIEPGHDDKFKMDGEDGPSTTERTGAWKISMEYTHDFADPAAGHSTYDAWKAQFSGVSYVPVMIVLDSGEKIPSCTNATYQVAWYCPKMKISTDRVDRKNDGTKPKVKVKLEHRIDPSVNTAMFMKLII
jgi:hypothetical protein